MIKPAPHANLAVRVRSGATGSPSFLRCRASLIVCIIFAVAATGGVAFAASDLSPAQQRQVLEEAQHMYDQGIAVLRDNPAQARTHFADAASRFQLVADSDIENGPLFYNLANAYLQAGDLGRAILNYRRAEELIPGDARLQSNLQYARSLCRSQIESSGQNQLMSVLLSWHRRTPLSWRFGAFLVCNACLWLLMGLQLFRPGGLVRLAAIALGVAWIILGASVVAQVFSIGQMPYGVITAESAIVRKGNGIGFEPRFQAPLHAGVEFSVLEHRGDWINIQFRNGEDGWIQQQDAQTAS